MGVPCVLAHLGTGQGEKVGASSAENAAVTQSTFHHRTSHHMFSMVTLFVGVSLSEECKVLTTISPAHRIVPDTQQVLDILLIECMNE